MPTGCTVVPVEGLRRQGGAVTGNCVPWEDVKKRLRPHSSTGKRSRTGGRARCRQRRGVREPQPRRSNAAAKTVDGLLNTQEFVVLHRLTDTTRNGATETVLRAWRTHRPHIHTPTTSQMSGIVYIDVDAEESKTTPDRRRRSLRRPANLQR